MICDWCDKEGTGEFELVQAMLNGVRFTAHLHKRVCKKKWIEEAAGYGTEVAS